METISLYHHKKPHIPNSHLPFHTTASAAAGNPSPKPSLISFPNSCFKAKARNGAGGHMFNRDRLSPTCVDLNSGIPVEAMVRAEEEEEWRRSLGKGREGKVVAELLECLEREAIMGNDEGKEPSDYDRRARIFDKSSRIFQALKQLNTSSTDSDQ